MRRLRGDRGDVLVTVLMVPLVLISMLAVVQFALAYHARQVLAGAVQDAAASGARRDSSPGAGAALADRLIGDAAGSLLTSWSTSAGGGEQVTVSASGNVVKVFPLFPTITVRATGAARLERFEAQGSP